MSVVDSVVLANERAKARSSSGLKLNPARPATVRHRLVLGWGDTQRRRFTATRGTRPVQGTNRGEGEEVKVQRLLGEKPRACW